MGLRGAQDPMSARLNKVDRINEAPILGLILFCKLAYFLTRSKFSLTKFLKISRVKFRKNKFPPKNRGEI
jgi:hypothetical protein